jgi:hypothetical protein
MWIIAGKLENGRNGYYRTKMNCISSIFMTRTDLQTINNVSRTMALEQTYERKHNGYHMWRRNCLPTRNT